MVAFFEFKPLRFINKHFLIVKDPKTTIRGNSFDRASKLKVEDKNFKDNLFVKLLPVIISTTVWATLLIIGLLAF